MAFDDTWLERVDESGEEVEGFITVTSQLGRPGTGLLGGKKVEEVRVVDPITGGEKGSKLARFDLLPADPLRQLAEHYGKGAEKYEPRNWEKSYAWSLSYAALQRHANAFWGGEDFDPESGSHHMIAVAWHALALVEFARTHREKDDRPHG